MVDLGCCVLRDGLVFGILFAGLVGICDFADLWFREFARCGCYVCLVGFIVGCAGVVWIVVGTDLCAFGGVFCFVLGGLCCLLAWVLSGFSFLIWLLYAGGFLYFVIIWLLVWLLFGFFRGLFACGNCCLVVLLSVLTFWFANFGGCNIVLVVVFARFAVFVVATRLCWFDVGFGLWWFTWDLASLRGWYNIESGCVCLNLVFLGWFGLVL